MWSSLLFAKYFRWESADLRCTVRIAEDFHVHFDVKRDQDPSTSALHLNQATLDAYQWEETELPLPWSSVYESNFHEFR